jgi:hypothetical protein
MTDIRGKVPSVGDTIVKAFREGNTASLRLGKVLEIFPTPKGLEALIEWSASSDSWFLPKKPTRCQMRDYCIIS